MMNFYDQSRSCHAERSEASLFPSRETLRFAQGNNTLPTLIVKLHYQGSISLIKRCVVDNIFSRRIQKH